MARTTVLAMVLAAILAWWTPKAVQADNTQCFTQSGFCLTNSTIANYFTHRGGVNTFGYPTSQPFSFEGTTVQFFQRRIIQIEPNGQAGLLNVLDPSIMPYTQFNGATFPASDPHITSAAPPATNQAAALAFVQAYVPNTWEGSPVNFYQTFTGTVTCADAYPNGGCQAQLLPGMDLEMWGMPTSMPAMDPNNHSFIYQRFQRGVMMYDATTGLTQDVLFGQYLKDIMTGQGLPTDLADEACGNQGVGPSLFCSAYHPGNATFVLQPNVLPNTDLSTAFIQDDPTTQAHLHSQVASLNPCQRGFLVALQPNTVMNVSLWGSLASPTYVTNQPGPLYTICQSYPTLDPTVSLGSFVYLGRLVRPEVYLAPGVTEALSSLGG